MSSAPRTPERDQLLKGVDEIAGVIRADAAVSEALRHLPESSVEALERTTSTTSPSSTTSRFVSGSTPGSGLTTLSSPI